MKYDYVKAGMMFVEVFDPKHPKRTPRVIKVRAPTRYAAEVEVLEGRGTGKVLYIHLKKICDPTQWEPHE